jgi:3,4-dihydroxy 2-butanone 4-phosphate synthase / GTP cyclohydrolase II
MSFELGGEGLTAVFTAHVYRAVPGVRRREYVALVLGDVADGDTVPVRVHVASLIEDVFGGETNRNKPRLLHVIDAIVRRGRGVVLYFASRETIGAELGAAFKSRELSGTLSGDREGVLREYGIGAQILLDLGIKKLQLISSTPRKLVGFDAWGFESIEQISLEEV